MADEVVAPQLARVKPVEIAERIKKNDIVIVDVRDEKVCVRRHSVLKFAWFGCL